MAKLLNRLARQTGSKALATKVLVKRGQALPSGLLTEKGKAREKLGDAGRAIDRKSPNALHANFQYNPLTNKAKRVR